MRLGRMLYPVNSLGPGQRLGIWVQGCGRGCPGCANPELQPYDEAKEIPLDIISKMALTAIKLHGLEGITITGGEPMDQAKELSTLLDFIRPNCSDILVFTGYTKEELENSNDVAIRNSLSKISVLVDGPYIKERNQGELLRGSENQRIIYLDPQVEAKYLAYLKRNERIMDNFVGDNGVIAVGIHPQEFLDDTKSWGDRL